MDHQPAQQRREPGHDDVRQIPRFQRGQEGGHKEAGIGPHHTDPVTRRQHRQGLCQKLPRAVGRSGMPGPQRGPQQPPALTQPGDQRMMGRPAVFDRIVPLQAARLLAIPTEHRRVQIQRMAQQNRPHGAQRHAHQGLGYLGGPSVREPLEEAPQRIRRGKPREAQQAPEQGIAAIAGEVFKSLGAQRQPIPPGQQDIHGGNLIVGRSWPTGRGRL